MLIARALSNYEFDVHDQQEDRGEPRRALHDQARRPLAGRKPPSGLCATARIDTSVVTHVNSREVESVLAWHAALKAGDAERLWCRCRW